MTRSIVVTNTMHPDPGIMKSPSKLYGSKAQRSVEKYVLSETTPHEIGIAENWELAT